MTLEEIFASKVKIVQILRRAGKPLIAQHIAKRGRLTPQLVGYQLEQMADWGIVTTSIVEDKKFYQLQKPYCSDDLLEMLSGMLIPFMSKVSTQMDFTQVKISPTEAVIRNLFMFLRLFETEIEKLSFNKNDKNVVTDSACEPLK